MLYLITATAFLAFLLESEVADAPGLQLAQPRSAKGVE
jgi:hypothetical protein